MINKFNIKEVRDFWDKVADIYEEENKKVGYVHYHRYEKAIEYGNFRSGQKVLNIWSRMGGFIPYIRKIPQIELMNYEVSPKFIEQAKIKFRNEDFSQTDLENLEDLQDDYFDRVVSLETLEHAPKPLEFVKELYRVLKPGGLLIMSLPPKGFEIPTMLWGFFAGNHGEGPHNFLWPYQVKKIINDSYLIIISFVYIVAYFVYSKLVFQKEINKEQISRFTLVMIIFWFLNNVFYKIFLDFFSIQYLIAAIINIMFLGGIRFVVYRNFVFIK